MYRFCWRVDLNRNIVDLPYKKASVFLSKQHQKTDGCFMPRLKKPKGMFGLGRPWHAPGPASQLASAGPASPGVQGLALARRPDPGPWPKCLSLGQGPGSRALAQVYSPWAHGPTALDPRLAKSDQLHPEAVTLFEHAVGAE